uniref:WASH complex subunit 2 n=1 Tax=Globodera pallida TaxID=36090 RepID=A0A183BPL2_GLOPA
MNENLGRVESTLQRSIDVLETRVEFLELGTSTIDEFWLDNGHEDENKRLPADDEQLEEGENSEERESNVDLSADEEDEERDEKGEEGADSTCEIMMADPFLMNRGNGRNDPRAYGLTGGA